LCASRAVCDAQDLRDQRVIHGKGWWAISFEQENWADDDPRRVASRRSVIAVLQRDGPLTRSELVSLTGLSRATVSSVVSELQHTGLVVDGEAEPDGGPATAAGRRGALVSLNRAAGVAVGIDFGKRHLRVAIADLAHTVLAERATELPVDHAAAEGVELAGRLVEEVLAEAGVGPAEIVAIGMGLPGPVSRRTGRLGSSTILPGWVGVDPQEAMSATLEMPVTVDNDANLGALAEWIWGAAQGCDDVVYLKASTGVGAGLILAGQPYRGAGGTAGEIGHTIIDASGPMCRCGNRGCLETLVGIPALLALFAPAFGQITIGEIIARAQDGDPACRRVLDDAGRTIGNAAAHLCNLINPQRIVVGGELAGAGELLLEPLREAITRAAIPSAAEEAVISAGVLAERAEVLGAVALALRESGRGLRPRRLLDGHRA
jgi:predicted NBD/HSP70 family sugar kinase